MSPYAMTSSVAQNSEAAPKIKWRNMFIFKKRKKREKKKLLLLGRQYKVFRETKHHAFIQDLNVSEGDMCRHCSNEPRKTKAV